jgi:hypothetical protein
MRPEAVGEYLGRNGEGDDQTRHRKASDVAKQMEKMHNEDPEVGEGNETQVGGRSGRVVVAPGLPQFSISELVAICAQQGNVLAG